MKTKRLDGRFRANKRWGYTWQVKFVGIEWRKYFAFNAQAKSMFGDSKELFPSFLWRDSIQLLETAPWAYHYDKSSKPSYVYFRTKTDMEQCLMMFALTGQA